MSADGLSPIRTAFANGVVVLAKETRKTPAVSINLSMRAGSISDPADAPGAMHLLARVIDRGTATRSAADIAEDLDNRGVSLNILVTRHLFSLVCTCLADDFESVFSLLGDILMTPSVPDAELATRKGEVVTSIRQDDDSPFVRASEGLMSMLYGEAHPYGRRVKGTIDAVERISRETLVGLHRARFAPSELMAVVVGDAEPTRVLEIADRVLGSWNRPAPEPVPLAHPTPASTRRRLIIPMMNKTQADVAYGFTTIARLHPDYYAYWLMNHVLGQYSIGGRLGDSIRERQGMAYYCGSAFEANVIEGPLFVRAGVNPSNVDRAVASIDEEMRKIRSEGVVQKELDDSRRYLLGSMPRALETNAGIANFLQSAEFFGLGLDHDLRLASLLGAVTLDAVNAAARRAVDPDRASIAIAGPYDERD